MPVQPAAVSHRHRIEPWPRRWHRATALTIALLLLGGCGDPTPKDSPIERIERWLETAEAAIEQRDLDAFGSMIADNYTDPNGNDREAILRRMQLIFLRHRAPEIVIQTREVRLVDANHADIRLVGAAANAGGIGELQGRLMKGLLSLRWVDDRWTVEQAQWTDAGVADFLRE